MRKYRQIVSLAAIRSWPFSRLSPDRRDSPSSRSWSAGFTCWSRSSPSGVNNTLSIDATSCVNFNGKITSNDLLINLRADINQINANELAISKTSGIGISCYDSAIATKEIQASSTNILNINASAGVIFNGDITASGKNITAAKFIGNLTGNVTGYAGQISTVFTTSSATFTLTDGTSTKNIVFIY